MEKFTEIFTIGVGIVLVVSIVLITQAGVLDNATREVIQSSMNDFGNAVVREKEITLEAYNKLNEQINAAGVTGYVNLTLEVPDSNYKKKVSMIVKDKAGENPTILIPHTEIMKQLNDSGKYKIPTNATFSSDFVRTNESWTQGLTNGLFRTNGKDSGSTEASFTSLVP